MWTSEHQAETPASHEQIGRLRADVPRWPEWNGGIERIELFGPFAAESKVVMTPIHGEPIALRIMQAIEPEVFVDEADIGELVVRTIHRVERIASAHPRITHRIDHTPRLPPLPAPTPPPPPPLPPLPPPTAPPR